MFLMTHIVLYVTFDSGNLEGQPPYMTGDSSCSNCPDDKKSCINNLCNDGEMLHIITCVKRCTLVFCPLLCILSHAKVVRQI